MIQKRLLLLAICLTASSLFAQNLKLEKPDYKKIKKAIKKKSSNFYYPNLIERFNNADSSLSLEEKRHLYYGYTFEESYSPYGNSRYNDSLMPLLKIETHNYEELEKIKGITDLIIQEDPFDLRAINYQLYASDKLADSENFDKRIIQLNILIEAMLSSGDGISKKTAFYVISTSHEYDLLNILGFSFGGSQSLIEHYDYLTISENKQGIEGLYFDVSPCLDHLNEMFK